VTANPFFICRNRSWRSASRDREAAWMDPRGKRSVLLCKTPSRPAVQEFFPSVPNLSLPVCQIEGGNEHVRGPSNGGWSNRKSTTRASCHMCPLLHDRIAVTRVLMADSHGVPAVAVVGEDAGPRAVWEPGSFPGTGSGQVDPPVHDGVPDHGVFRVPREEEDHPFRTCPGDRRPGRRGKKREPPEIRYRRPALLSGSV